MESSVHTWVEGISVFPAENVLALERKDGGSLVAEITPDSDGNFNFRMLGAPDEDQGLDFSK